MKRKLYQKLKEIIIMSEKSKEVEVEKVEPEDVKDVNLVKDVKFDDNNQEVEKKFTLGNVKKFAAKHKIEIAAVAGAVLAATELYLQNKSDL